ncbi:MAG: ribulose-phosphate 3-epimerase [Muribaculaceae bacterium]|nr:ribulose-phosphate 3-epimerase [Muribaculaceae bacterium]
MLVSPSLLAADFANLKPDLEMINNSDADYLHIDVMDGVFVPNISFGFPLIEAVKKVCQKPLDVHLMIVEPQKWVTQIRDSGAYIMNVHLEACLHLDRTVHLIHEAGMKAGVTLNPATPVSLLEDIIDQVDLILLMSVNPGFGAQRFIDNTLRKVKELRSLIKTSNSRALIEVDGGINEYTGKLLAQAGADILVSGSFIFNSSNPLERISSLKALS